MIKRLINNEKIYHEFASWKLENDPFIKKLKKVLKNLLTHLIMS